MQGHDIVIVFDISKVGRKVIFHAFFKLVADIVDSGLLVL